MNTALLILTEVRQHSQELNTGGDHMISDVLYRVTIGDKTYDNLTVGVKQPAGGDFHASELEIGSAPVLDDWALNSDQFHKAVEHHYRKCVGTQAHGIAVQGNASVFMANNTFVIPTKTEIEIHKVDGKTKIW